MSVMACEMRENTYQIEVGDPYMDFYVGNNGDFDRIATSVILA